MKPSAQTLILAAALIARLMLSPQAAGTAGDPVSVWPALQQIKAPERTTSLIPRPGGLVRIEADKQEKNDLGVWVAEGHVVVTYQETKLEADKIEYFEEAGHVVATGTVTFTRGAERFTGSRAEYDVDTGRGVFYDVHGKTDREYYLEADRIDMESRTTFRLHNGFITACQEAVPKWRLSTHSAFVDTESHATLRGSVFKVKRLPVLYLPFVRVPLEKKERGSGFLIPSTGTSTTKGRAVSGAYYLVLGRSADALFFGDYFSKRGVGGGLRFRTRPNEQTWLNFSTYYVTDREKNPALNASGANISAQGQTYFKNGFRGVVNVSLVSNDRFRQVFAQDFRAATNTVEKSAIFLTNNFGAHSVNFLFARNEVFLPYPASRSLVVRNAPVINFKTLGQQITEWPLYFFLDSSIEGLNRIQSPDVNTITLTPEFVQRLDLFPRLLIPFRQWAGISFSALLGARDTFYSHSYAEDDTRTIIGRHLNRRYVTAELTAKGPGFAKVYKNAEGKARFKHWIEPEVTYRRIQGIDRFQRTIRFDDKDAIADTSEFEYALANRIFIKQTQAGGETTTREWLYFRLGQKYFFDPTFGGALIEGQANQFFPINTQTAFSYGGLRRRFAPISGLLRWYASWLYNAEVRADYDPKAHSLRNGSVAGTITYHKLSFAATYAYTKEIRVTDGTPETSPPDRPLLRPALFCQPGAPNVKCDAGTFHSNQWQGQIGFGDPRKGFSAGTMYTYDILGTPVTFNGTTKRRHLLGSTTRLHYNWDCCGIALEAQQFGIGLRTETLFRFSFTLGGIGSFGTIRRPQNLF